MRRAAALVLALAVLAACSSDDEPGIEAHATSSTVQAGAEVPASLGEFLDGVAAPGTVAFRATYDVLRRAGGDPATLEVLADPPSWQLRTGDLVVVDGPDRTTCRPSTRRCVRGIREALLVPVGVFSRFFSTGTSLILATDGRRSTVGEPELSERTIAGVPVRCIAVPVGGRVASAACLTAEGVFASFDNAATHFELTSYRAGPPGEPVDPPYEIRSGGTL